MSYCRFSSDDWGSDVYCYESRDGFVVHVAALRFESNTPIPPIPTIQEWGAIPPEELAAQFDARQAWIDAARRVPIGMVFDGESFTENSAADALDLLKMLRNLGYRVPQHAIDALREGAESGVETADVA